MRIDVYRVERWVGFQAPHAASMRLKLAQEGFHVDQWCDRPGMFYGKHKHPEAQSHWVISGEIEITVPTGTYLLGPGDRDYMPADTLHTARVIGEGPVTYLVGVLKELALPIPPKKRGRPKKVRPPESSPVDDEFDSILRMFGITPSAPTEKGSQDD